MMMICHFWEQAFVKLIALHSTNTEEYRIRLRENNIWPQWYNRAAKLGGAQVLLRHFGVDIRLTTSAARQHLWSDHLC